MECFESSTKRRARARGRVGGFWREPPTRPFSSSYVFSQTIEAYFGTPLPLVIQASQENVRETVIRSSKDCLVPASSSVLAFISKRSHRNCQAPAVANLPDEGVLEFPAHQILTHNFAIFFF